VEQAMLTINEPASILEDSSAARQPRRIHLVVLSSVLKVEMLVTVAEVKANDCWIITGYWEERS
jgi:hypothetical protein